jgi:Zn-dependent peptidase ImmA (M78 family)
MIALTAAERILKSLGIESPGEIDLEAIAWTRGAVVNYRPLDRCEATIVGSKRRAVIAVNSRSPPDRRRFSLAHELGHWHHHKGRMLFCVETGNHSRRFKSRNEDRTTSARPVSATPTGSDGGSATARTSRPRGSILDAD